MVRAWVWTWLFSGLARWMEEGPLMNDLEMRMTLGRFACHKVSISIPQWSHLVCQGYAEGGTTLSLTARCARQQLHVPLSICGGKLREGPGVGLVADPFHLTQQLQGPAATHNVGCLWAAFYSLARWVDIYAASCAVCLCVRSLPRRIDEESCLNAARDVRVACGSLATDRKPKK